jgi:hypothetical protein
VEPGGMPRTAVEETVVREGLQTTKGSGEPWVDRAVLEAWARPVAKVDPGVMGRPVIREPAGRTGQPVALEAPEVSAWLPVGAADLVAMPTMWVSVMPLPVQAVTVVPEPKEVRVGPGEMHCLGRATR